MNDTMRRGSKPAPIHLQPFPKDLIQDEPTLCGLDFRHFIATVYPDETGKVTCENCKKVLRSQGIVIRDGEAVAA